MKRRVIPGIMFLILSFATARLAAAADTVRILAAQAAIHLNADPNSLTVATIPAGTVLEVHGRQGSWYAVWLPSDRQGGPRRLGYLAASDGELTEAETRHSQPAAAPAEPPVETRSLPPMRKLSSGDFDGFSGVTFRLPGARAIVATPVATADSGEHNTLPTFGFTIGTWFGDNRMSGLFFDFSGVDGGSATAQVGSNNRAEASFTVADFHGGWQIQYPGRIRPYVFGGVGVYFQKSTGSLTLLGGNAGSIDQTDHFLSFVFGGGVRFMIGQRWGAKVGIDALSAKVTDSGYANYGRFVAGSFYSF
jgi:hypothetical protein